MSTMKWNRIPDPDGGPCLGYRLGNAAIELQDDGNWRLTLNGDVQDFNQIVEAKAVAEPKLTVEEEPTPEPEVEAPVEAKVSLKDEFGPEYVKAYNRGWKAKKEVKAVGAARDGYVDKHVGNEKWTTPRKQAAEAAEEQAWEKANS